MRRAVMWLPSLVVVALSPALLGLSCSPKTGNPDLVSLEVEASGSDRLVGFDNATTDYSVWTLGAASVTIRGEAEDPGARISWERGTDFGVVGFGFGETTIDAPADGEAIYVTSTAPGQAQKRFAITINPSCVAGECDDADPCTADVCNTGTSTCEFTAEPDGTLCDFAGSGDGMCNAGVCENPPFPCTEQGILDAIVMGGGPRFFDCAGPTTVATTAEILIDNDVILEGGGNLTVDAGGTHRVVHVVAGVAADLRGMTLTGGHATTANSSGLVAGHGVSNEGSLTLTNVSVVSNGLPGDFVGGIWSLGEFVAGEPTPTASLRVVDSIVSSNESLPAYGIAGGIFVNGSLEIVRSTIADNGLGTAVSVVSGLFPGTPFPTTVSIEDSTISSTNDDWSVFFDQWTEGTVTRSMVSGSTSALAAHGTLRVRDSALVGGSSEPFFSRGLSVGSEADAILENTTITGWGGLSVSGGAGGSTALFNVTVVAAGGSGLDTSGSANVTLESCVLSPGCAGSGSISSLGHNVDTDGSCGFSDPTDQVNVTPAQLNLGPLQDNGGPTQTMLPGPGSVAIDQIPLADCLDADGMPLSTDQRGITRPQGTNCDVGAVEVEQP